jgi:hypothetical protein
MPNNADVNAMLATILILLATLAVAFWVSPRGCRWLSLRLYCRAVQIEAGRQAFADAMEANTKVTAVE